MSHRVSTHSNGARVITERVEGSRTVAVGCYVGVGTRDEPAVSVGASHFLEHLLFKGTQSRTARDIAEMVDSTGGDMNAYTTKEYTAFYLRVPAQHFDAAVDLLCDVVTAPGFGEADFESERQVILEELHLQKDEPDDLVHTLLYEAMFPEHSLGWEIVGHERSIKAMSPRSVRAFHRRWYTPANMIFAAAGPIEHRQLATAVRRGLGSAPQGRPPVRRRPRRAAAARQVVRRDGETVHLALGWRAFDHNDEDRYALALANQILGGGMSSRLFQTIREEHGLAYAVFSSIAAYSDAGVLSIYAGTTPPSTTTVLDLAREIVAGARDGGVTEHELDVAKGAFEGSTVMNAEDMGSRMARLGIGMVTRGSVVPLDRYLDDVRATTIDDVHRACRRVLDRAPTLAAVGPVPPRSVRW